VVWLAGETATSKGADMELIVALVFTGILYCFAHAARLYSEQIHEAKQRLAEARESWR